jgi:hypothetical protein
MEYHVQGMACMFINKQMPTVEGKKKYAHFVISDSMELFNTERWRWKKVVIMEL